jgi:hypothetical protein
MMNRDDPFAKLFINPDEIKKQIAQKLAICFKEAKVRRAQQQKNMEI